MGEQREKDGRRHRERQIPNDRCTGREGVGFRIGFLHRDPPAEGRAKEGDEARIAFDHRQRADSASKKGRGQHPKSPSDLDDRMAPGRLDQGGLGIGREWIDQERLT
jgi:hypothetical protein